MTGKNFAWDRKLEKSEIELLEALAQLRKQRQRLKAENAKSLTPLARADMLRKNGPPPQTLDVNGVGYILCADGAYRRIQRNATQNTRDAPLSNAPQPTVVLRSSGGPAEREREALRAIELIQRTAKVGKIIWARPG